MSIDRGQAHQDDLEKIASMLDGLAWDVPSTEEGMPSVQEAAEKLREIGTYLNSVEQMLEVERVTQDPDGEAAGRDEKDAVQFLATMVRAIEKWDADERIKNRAARGKEWLSRYFKRKPPNIFREEQSVPED